MSHSSCFMELPLFANCLDHETHKLQNPYAEKTYILEQQPASKIRALGSFLPASQMQIASLIPGIPMTVRKKASESNP